MGLMDRIKDFGSKVINSIRRPKIGPISDAMKKALTFRVGQHDKEIYQKIQEARKNNPVRTLPSAITLGAVPK